MQEEADLHHTAASAEIARLGAMPNDALELQLERLPRHHLFAEIPAALRDWLLPIEWDRELLWALELPRRRLTLEELRWHLDLPWWRSNGVWFQVTPREYLARPVPTQNTQIASWVPTSPTRCTSSVGVSGGSSSTGSIA